MHTGWLLIAAEVFDRWRAGFGSGAAGDLLIGAAVAAVLVLLRTINGPLAQ
jgi:hypothetical protein